MIENIKPEKQKGECSMFEVGGNSREYTEEEMLYMFLKELKGIKDYWMSEKVSPDTLSDRMNGLCFSILSLIDGCDINFEAILELVPTVHPTNKESHQKYGEKWFPNQQEKHLKKAGIKSINNGHQLHELWYLVCENKLIISDGKIVKL